MPFALALVAAVLAPGYARGSVADMRRLASCRPELVHHWTFEGAWPAACLADHRCGLRLRSIFYPSGRPATPDLHAYGPDRTSRCLRFTPRGSRAGVVVATAGPVRFPREATLELLFRADSVRPGEFNKGWMAFARTRRGNRLYFAGIGRVRPAAEVLAGFGTSSPFHPRAEVVIAGGPGRPGFRLGQWYYLAVTYSHALRGGAFTVNAFIGPVGEHGARLVHAVRNARRPGSSGRIEDAVLFLGCAAGPSQLFHGAIDEVAFYDRALPREVLEKHFRALAGPVVPEQEVSLMLCKPSPTFQVSKELAARHADAYTKEWQHTSPDLVVFIPPAETGPQAENQHFLVFPLKNGDFFAVWTSAFRESHPNQHIVFSKSHDRGVTWTKPVTIAGPAVVEKNGEKTYEGLASWGFPIYVPDKNRIYVFYQKGIGVYDPRPGNTGEVRFVYTDDEGATWSREYTVPMRRPAIAAPDPSIPPNWIIWQIPVEIVPGQILGCGTIWASDRLTRTNPQALVGSECWFWRFDNILTEEDPSKIRVTLLPDGDHGIRMPNAPGSRVSTAEEPTVVRLSDGRWFCVFRTFRGAIGYAISTDEGHTWSESQILRYRDDGPPILQPTASCPLYPLGDGRFLLTFHNNDGAANGGSDPWDWRRNRTPAFYSVGHERLDKKQPIWFTPPIMFLNNDAKPWGPTRRTEVATYPSFFVFEGKRWYWYPDRKHFLLGKFITDEMLAEAEKLR